MQINLFQLVKICYTVHTIKDQIKKIEYCLSDTYTTTTKNLGHKNIKNSTKLISYEAVKF